MVLRVRPLKMTIAKGVRKEPLKYFVSFSKFFLFSLSSSLLFSHVP
jgi:hypothetical protein